MEIDSIVSKRVENLKEIILRVKWLDLSDNIEVISLDNIAVCELSFIARALNTEFDEIYNLLSLNQEDLRSLFKKALKSLYNDTLNINNAYNTLLSDSVIPPSPYLNAYLSSITNTSESISSLFFSELPYKIYKTIQKYNLFYNTQSLLKLQVTNEKPANQDSNIEYPLAKNDTLISGNKRKDNFLILGCNCLNKIVDVNLFNDYGKEKVLGILALRNDGIYAVDLQENRCFGIGVIEPIVLQKHFVFKLGNLAILTVLNIRSSRNPFIEVKITGSEDSFTFTDIDRKYYAGKIASDLRCIVSGVSNQHCCIYYDKNINKWMLQDENSTNGTSLLLKNYNEYTNNHHSRVVNCGPTNVVLTLGSQKFLVTKSE